MRCLLLLPLSMLLVLLPAGDVLSTSHTGHPPPEGKAIIDYITNVDDYHRWELWPGKGPFYKGQHPHGSFLTTYLSPEAIQAMKDKLGVMPVGAVVVKENYTVKRTLDTITVMYKSAGYNSEAGDWYWLKFSPDGAIAKEGKVQSCIACHAMVKGNDWLFTGPLK